MPMKILLAILIILLQAVEFRDLKSRDGVQVAENRFTGESFIRTKPAGFTGSTGKGNVFDPRANSAEMTFIAGRVSKSKDIVVMVIPQATTKLSRFIGSNDRTRFYIQSDAHLFAIVDGERFDFGAVYKSADLDVFGQYDGAGLWLVPFDSFKKLANADKLEMAVGVIELHLTRQIRNRLQNLALAVQDLNP